MISGAVVDGGGEEVAGKHQGSRAHPGDSLARPEVAQVGLAMHAATAAGGCTTAAELRWWRELGKGRCELGTTKVVAHAVGREGAQR